MSYTRPGSRALVALLALLTAVSLVMVAPPVAAQDNGEQDAPVDRIAGANRVATAVAVSAAAFTSAESAVIARPDVYADALAAGPLAAALGGPILLAGSTDDLDAGVRGELDRLGVQTVFIMGGTGAVPAAVEDALNDDFTVERVAGANRFATAQEIIRQLEAVADVDTVVVVKGVDDADPTQGFADALSASWWAGQQGFAIAPVRTDSVPDGHVEVLQDAGVTDAYIVGGTAAVSSAVEDALGGGGVGLNLVARLSGADRYETSAVVWNTGVAQGASPLERWTARGDEFADALSSGPAVAAAGYTFTLVPPTDLDAAPSAGQVFSSTPEYLDRVVILGGTAAVSQQVADDIDAVSGFIPLTDVAYCLTVLHNNDGESQLIESANGPQFGGVARFASVVERERQLATDGFPGDGCGENQSILLNSGDNFLAGAEFEASVDQNFSPFYDAVALEAIGYDAFTIGNHGFDFGPEVLATFIEAVQGTAGAPPFVSINLQTAGTPLDGLVEPSTVVTKGTRTIGVIGASPTNLAQISSPGDVEVLDFADTVAAVNAEAQRLRDVEGVDLVVFQSHLQNIDSDLELIAQTTGVDIAIAGGGDEQLGSYGNLWLPQEAFNRVPISFGPTGAPVQGTYPVQALNAGGDIVPIVTTPGDYEYLGRLRVQLDDDSDVDFSAGSRDLIDPRSRLVRVVDEAFAPDGVTPDPDLVTNVVDPVAAFVAAFDSQEIGENTVPLDGVRSNVRTRQTNVGSLLSDSYIYAAEQGGFTGAPNVALTNGGGIRNDSVIDTGAFTRGEAISIAPFGNAVVTFENVTAAQVKGLLEHGYSGLPDVEGRYSQVGGLIVEVDPSQTAQVVNEAGEITTPGERVRSVALQDGGAALVTDGAVVGGAPTVNLTTVDFLANGGDNYPFADLGFATFNQVSPDYRLALENFVSDATGLNGLITAADYPQDPPFVTILGG